MSKEIVTRVAFKVDDKMVVADPCYIDQNDTIERLQHVGLGIVIDDCEGTWVAEVEISDERGWGDRVSILRATRQGTTAHVPAWERVNNNGVDSGQMFIGCLTSFPLDYQALLDRYLLPNGDWDNDLKFLAFGEGAVSSTGLGDGCYPVYVKRSLLGRPLAIEIRFLEDSDEESYD